MRKFLLLTLILSFLILPMQVVSATENADSNTIRILLNNSFVNCDQPPIAIEGRTMVPVRAIFEALGATVDWNSDTQTVTSTKNDTTVTLTLNNNTMYVNGEAKTLDVPAQAVNGRTLVPVRAIAEAFNCTVSWNGYKKYVIVLPNNQAPYRVEVLNDISNVIAAARFDNRGQLLSVTGNGSKYLAPFFVNINGHNYIDHLGSATYYNTGDDLSLSYNTDGYLITAKWTRADNTTIYNYQYENGALSKRETDSPYMSSSYYTSYEYGKKDGSDVCKIGNRDYYYFNDFGLLDKYVNFSAGEWTRNYFYDEQNRLVKETYNGGGIITVQYTYGDDNKLATAQYSAPLSNIKETVSYRYVTE